MVIGERQVGPGHPCLIVAEVAQAHDGSLGNAHAFIDAVAAAGADAVKFQCHEGDPVNEWRVAPEWPQDADRAAYWERTGFDWPQWCHLQEHAHARGLLFIVSPFSLDAVPAVDYLADALKVGSGQVTNLALLDAIAATKLPVILSTGMATMAEVRAAELRLPHRQRAVLHCTSAYPTPPDRVGLRNIGRLIDADPARPVGLSDHSGAIWPSVAAVALGASIVEVHVCWSRQQYGPDTSSSVTVEQLAQLVEGVRFTEKALRPVDKDTMARELAPMRRLFMGAA